MTGNVLAIDQGTSGTKAIVVCPDRGVLAEHEVSIRPTYGADGSVEQDPQELLASVLDAGRAVIAEAGEPVVALGLANQGETILAWDPATGAPLTTCIGWQDRRSSVVCDRLSAAAAARLVEISGLAVDPYFVAPKMVWLRENLTTQGMVTTSDAWLVHALTGRALTDVATASRTMLLDLDAGAWSPEAVGVFGLGAEVLPEVVDCAGAFGVTEAFGSPLMVSGLVVDQQAALLADSCFLPGQAKCTYGTGAFLLANTGETPIRSSAGLTPSVAWRVGGGTTYCLDGQVFTAASAVRWLVELGVIASARELDAVGGSVPDAGTVTFVPALAGLGAPWGRPDALGCLSGLGLSANPGHVVRALLDGIAAQIAEMADAVAVELGTPISVLRVDGGLTRSTLLMQAQADLLQAPVEVAASAHATALGVAALARIGVDPTLSLADAVGPWRPAAVYEPRISADEAAARRTRFRSAVSLSLAAGP